MFDRALIFLAFVFFMSSQSFAQTLEDGNLGWQRLETFIQNAPLATGDIILVTVRNVPDFSGKYTVDKNGQVKFPLIGKVAVSEHDPASLADQLEVLYEKDYLNNPFITVSLFTGTLTASSELDQTLNESYEVFSDSTDAPTDAPVESLESPRTFAHNPLTTSTAVGSQTEAELLSPASNLDFEISNLNINTEQSGNLSSLETTDWTDENDQQNFIRFLSGGDIVGTAECYNYFGSYIEDKGDIDIHDITSTRIECDLVSEPKAFLTTLNSARSYLIIDEKLLLINEKNEALLIFKSGLF